MNEHSVAAQIAVIAIQLGVILFAARIFGILAGKLRVPSVLGELIAGIVIGPYVLGSLGLPLHGFEHGLFPLPAPGAALPVSLPVYSIATIGSIVLLFISGLETDLRQFFRYSIAGTTIGIGGVIFSFGFGAGLGVWMFHTNIMDPRCLFLGILSTATSVGITARILSEKKRIDSPEGTTILAAAVIDDVLGIICLAITMGIVAASGQKGGSIAWGNIGIIAAKSFGIWLGITAAGLIFAHQIARFLKWFRPSATYAILALGLALLLAGFFESAGLAMIVGAYVMGLCLSKTDIAFAIQDRLESIYNFMVPIFFVVMGMLVDVRVFGDSDVVFYGLIYSVLAIAAKIIGCALPAYFMNFNLLGSLRIGMGMIPRGEVALIIAGIGSTTMVVINGTAQPVVDPKLFGICIIMTLLTTVAAPPLLSIMLNVKGAGVKHEVQEEGSVHTVYDLPSEVIRDFVVRIMQENFRHEGFRHSKIARDGGLVSFRRGSMVFALRIEDTRLDFESSPDEAVLIKTVMYETLVELHHTMTGLKSLAAPGCLGSVLTSEEPAAKPVKENKAAKILRLDRVIPESAVFLDIQAQDQKSAICEIISKLAAAGVVKNQSQCEEAVLKREDIYSTCIPGGIAFPHARTAGIDRLTSAVAISRSGVPATDGSNEKTQIFILTLCPMDADHPYLQYMSHIAKLLSNRNNIDAILSAADRESLRRIFIGMR